MKTVHAGPRDRHPQSAAVTLAANRGQSALRRLTVRDRRRILARLSELDQIAVLICERPFSSGWAA